jgi:hypothetical protein
MTQLPPHRFLNLVQSALIGKSTSHQPRGYASAPAYARSSTPNLVEAAHNHAFLWPEWVQIATKIKENSEDPEALTIAEQRLKEKPFFVGDDHIVHVHDQALMTVATAAETLGLSIAAIQKSIQRGRIQGAVQAQNGRWLVPVDYVWNKKYTK